ncbi:hypothetical protein CBW18_05370 [Pedobacter sp. AJM]|nr:hypothetical protein CBW18_05370 [Pedobacter sp. AJM]
MYYLYNAKLINTLSAAGKSISTLQKPDKIFLENTNLSFALSPNNTEKGSLREAFFMNQLTNAGHAINLPLKGDFYVNDQFTFEIGGKGKSTKQLTGIDNSFFAVDDMEAGIGNKIPLWMFGLLY